MESWNLEGKKSEHFGSRNGRGEFVAIEVSWSGGGKHRKGRKTDSDVEGDTAEQESNKLVNRLRGLDLLLDDAEKDLDHWEAVGGGVLGMKQCGQDIFEGIDVRSKRDQ